MVNMVAHGLFETESAGSKTLSTKRRSTNGDQCPLEEPTHRKEHVLTRRFGLVSMTGFSCALMCSWESMLVVFALGLENGGPAGLIYGMLLVWIGNISVFLAMGELSSIAPTAAGQYRWVSMLAPQRSRKFLSYITGWITVLGWVIGTVAASYFTSSLIEGLIILHRPSYEPTGWQGCLLLWAVLVVCVIMNTVLSKALPAIEIAILVLHVLGFFTIIIPLVYLTPKNSAGYVFTTWENSGGWSSQALSFLIGLNGSAMAFVGNDGAIHMSEEVKNPKKNVAWAMLSSEVINGCLSFAMLIALLFSAGNIQEALQNAPNGYPFITIFATGLGSNAWATALTSIIIVLEICSCIGTLAAASRMIWSFARDCGLPGHAQLRKVDRHTTIPLFAVLTAAVCAALIALIGIGSSVVLSAIASMVLEAFYLSYLLVCGLLLYQRLKGNIAEPSDETSDNIYTGNTPGQDKSFSINTSQDSGSDNRETAAVCQWGPWRLKGWLGVANNVFACLYLIIVGFFSFWPTSAEVDASTMNYSSLIVGSTIVLSIIYYFAQARKTYVGPITEVKVEYM